MRPAELFIYHVFPLPISKTTLGGLQGVKEVQSTVVLGLPIKSAEVADPSARWLSGLEVSAMGRCPFLLERCQSSGRWSEMASRERVRGVPGLFLMCLLGDFLVSFFFLADNRLPCTPAVVGKFSPGCWGCRLDGMNNWIVSAELAAEMVN